jgi:hypothetical protein
MSALIQMAESQAQRHQALKISIQAAGFDYRDLADSVNPQNLEPKSRDMFIQLIGSIQVLNNPLQAKSRQKGHDNSFSLG